MLRVMPSAAQAEMNGAEDTEETADAQPQRAGVPG
jgi:hypothetical protein